jgi:hypothetical protein
MLFSAYFLEQIIIRVCFFINVLSILVIINLFTKITIFIKYFNFV